MMVDAGDNMFSFEDPHSILRMCQNWKVNAPVLHFSFAMPEKIEAKNREQYGKVLDLLKKNDIHPFAHMKACSVFASSFFNKELGGFPQAQEWIHKTPQGFWFSYGINPERYLVCPSHKDWLDKCLLQTAKKAVDWGAEGIFLDNLEAGAPCYCEKCKSDFMTHLKKNFSPDQWQSEFGVKDIERVDPSNFVPATFRDIREFGQSFFPKIPWRNRLWQEWIMFQMRVVASCVNEFCRQIKKYAKERYDRKLLIMVNNSEFKDYRYLAAKRINFEMLDYDIVWCEWDYPQTYSELQLVKALTNGKPTVSYGKDLRHLYGDIWHISERNADPTFPRRHPEYYLGYETFCEIAVVCSLNSILFDNQFSAFEETLQPLCKSISIEAISLNKLKIEEIEKYKALILPEVTCISEDEAGKITQFAESGGMVFVSGETARYDEHAQRRENPLYSLLSTFRYQEGIKTIGKGRILYFTSPHELAKGVLEKVDHAVKIISGETDFLMAWEKNGNLTVRIGSSKDLILEIRKDKENTPIFPYIIAPSQEYLGKQRLKPIFEDKDRLILSLPDVAGFLILVLEREECPVSLSLSPDFQWIDSSEKMLSAKVFLSNLADEEKKVQLEASFFEAATTGWRTQFRQRGKIVSEVFLLPERPEEFDLEITPPDNLKKQREIELFPIVQVKAIDPIRSCEYDKASLNLQRQVGIFSDYSIARMDPDDTVNLNRAGLATIIFNKDNTLACRTKVAGSAREIPSRELESPQLIPRNGVIAGFVPQVYPWPRAQRPRFIKPFIPFCPALGSFVMSDHNYDQNQPEGVKNFTYRIIENSLDSVATLFEFDQGPFHVWETIRCNSGDPRFYVHYRLRAREDSLVYSWDALRFGIPDNPRIYIGTGDELNIFDCTPGEITIPEEHWIAFHWPEKKVSLGLEFYSLSPYDKFKRRSPFIKQGNLSFQSPTLYLPVTHHSPIEVKKGCEYEFDFALTLFPVIPGLYQTDYSQPEEYIRQGQEICQRRLRQTSLVYPRKGAAAITEVRYWEKDKVVQSAIKVLNQAVIGVRKIWIHPEVLVNGREYPYETKGDVIEVNLPQPGRYSLRVSES